MRLYLAVFALVAVAVFPAASLALFTANNLGCRSSGYSDDAYIDYCGTITFGDYAHGAIYYGLGHRQIETAKVIFLGDSRTQMGFSTEAIRKFFKEKQVPFYILGFGYNEYSKFELEILHRAGANPAVLVVNANPFFSEALSPPAQDIFDKSIPALWRYGLKMLFQPIHRTVCRHFACLEDKATIFRSAADGAWDWSNTFAPPEGAAIPVDGTFTHQIPASEIEQAVEIGGKFLQQVGLPRRCVVLTATPGSRTDGIGAAKKLATALGTSSIFPALDGMQTTDTHHLTRTSAERWSAEFMQMMVPLMKACGISDHAAS
jgi:hypothetical protein